MPIHDGDVMVAKELLKTQGLGHIVETVENHYDIETYRMKFGDSADFCMAYVDDMLDALGVAHEQNVRILAQHDLADCLQ